MRIPAYMSPTSLKTAENSWDDYYIKYLADVRAPRLPQTLPMSVGSAFDAYVKSFLHFNLFGNYGEGDGYAKDAIFEKQVEPHNRDWARLAGQYTFNCYKSCGALADLMLELGTAINKPRFEFDLLGTVETSIGDVPLLGKPDIYFINGEGARVVLDWKVNGYCGKSTTSPMSGYVMIRDAWTSTERKRSSGDRMPYKDCYPTVFKGLKINAQEFMEKRNEEWATQLAIYSWLLGEEVGSQDLIVGIDQIVGAPGAGTETYKVQKPNDLIPTDFQHQKPWLRVASHRMRVGAPFQHDLLCRLACAWGRITSGHIFSELSREESDERCKMLDEQSAMFANPDDPMADFINSTRSQ